MANYTAIAFAARARAEAALRPAPIDYNAIALAARARVGALLGL
jgi:hypothetical protein